MNEEIENISRANKSCIKCGITHYVFISDPKSFFMCNKCTDFLYKFWFKQEIKENYLLGWRGLCHMADGVVIVMAIYGLIKLF